MGFFDGFLNKMLLPSEDEDYDDYDDYDDYEKTVKKQPVSSVTDTKKTESEPAAYVRPKEKNTGKITPMRSSSRKAQIGMEVCVIKPTSFEDAREITETLLANQTVVLNVEGLDVDIAQRIIDFTSGSCFAINGNLQKISNFIFIITPENVEISGDIQNLVDSFGF